MFAKFWIILIFSLSRSYSALSLASEEVEETELPGLAVDQQTFYCDNVTGEAIIQVH